jgi:hypothetical protein
LEIENRVIEKIKQRQEVGMKKYGMSVKDNPAGTLEWLNHLQEELLDASIYIEKLKDEISIRHNGVGFNGFADELKITKHRR